MRINVLAVVPLALAIPFSSGAQQPRTDPAYAVYNAIFANMQFPKPDPLILIIATTQSSQCGDRGTSMVLINGCGIWGPPQTPEAVHDVLRKAWPQLSDSTWKSFIEANQTQSPLQNSVNPPWRHDFINFSDKKQSPEKPDGVVLLSSVGFNSDKSQALVYVLFLSYMQEATTSGNLFLVRRTSPGAWVIDGRETLIEMIK